MKRLQRSLRWLYPGMLVKRWAALVVVGMGLFLFGMTVRLQAPTPEAWFIGNLSAKVGLFYTFSGIKALQFGLVLSVLGVMLCLFAFLRMILSLIQAIDPERKGKSDLADVIYQRRILAHGKRIVVIGGGTGLSTLLRGLKQYTSNITAIVTVADDGGSSGKIVKQLNMLPPGDIRNCLVALADDETQMTELFQYRFGKSVYPEGELALAKAGAAGGVGVAENPEQAMSYGEGLRDHAFGNLLIAAMCAINRGDFQKAIRETSRVLNVRGRVLPSTVEHIQLKAEMEDGTFVEGETNIASVRKKIKRMMTVPENPLPADEVVEAIETADVIVLGPGSVFTSIIPNLLVKGIPEAIRRSKARKLYVCNVMTQRGETEGYSVFEHINALERHATQRIFDYVIVNTGVPAPEVLERYRKSGVDLVENDIDRVRAAGYRPLQGNFVNQSDIVRHNSEVLARTIIQLQTNKR